MPRQTRITTAGRPSAVSQAQLQQNLEAAGIPDSARFGGSPEADENPILSLHVGGVLVRDMLAKMEPSMAAIILSGLTYQATDEGIDANNEGKSERRAEVTEGPFQKALQQRKDDLSDREMEPFDARDPLKEVADEYVPPGSGFRPKYLSQRRMKDRGGSGNYEIVKDAKGDTVTVEGMVLGRIPEEKAVARNRHYQDKSRKLIKQIGKQFKEEVGKGAVVEE